jgi:hypothetical protein
VRCFELIKSVLDEAYDEIPDTSVNKNSAIKLRLQELSDGYSDLIKGAVIDYHDPVTRFAYVYRYVTSHAMMVYSLINSSTDLAAIFEREKVTVSCIGGGPGSDLVGILKYITEEGLVPFLKCYLSDKEKTWNESWSDVDEKIGLDLRVSTSFMPLDVEDPESVPGHAKIGMNGQENPAPNWK